MINVLLVAILRVPNAKLSCSLSVKGINSYALLPFPLISLQEFVVGLCRVLGLGVVWLFLME